MTQDQSNKLPLNSQPTTSQSDAANENELLHLVRRGDEAALTLVFTRYRERLRRMIQVRMNPRLQGRLDASDVVQDTYVEAARTLQKFVQDPQLPIYFWLRQLAHEKLIAAHRRHLEAQKRDASRDLSLHGMALNATSEAVAFELISQRSSPSEAMQKKSQRRELTLALEELEPLDREILTLKHFEQLTNREVSRLLEVSYEMVKKRYIRALDKLERLLRKSRTKTS